MRPSGTGFLKNTIAKHIKNHHNAYIMQNHGALCFGHDMERAVHNVEILEKCALAYLLALCTERAGQQDSPGSARDCLCQAAQGSEESGARRNQCERRIERPRNTQHVMRAWRTL